MLIEKIPIMADIMRIDTKMQTIDIQQINNRRFLYNPKTAVLVLGRQYGKTKGLPASHAEELAGAGSQKILMILSAAGSVLVGIIRRG